MRDGRNSDENESRQLVWLIGAGLALVVAVIVTMVSLWPSGEVSSASVAPALSWPASSRSPSAPGPGPVPSGSSAPSPTPSSARPSSSPSQTTQSPSKAAPAKSQPAKSAPPALTGPPSADRTGPITGGGACLDVAAGSIIFGNTLAVRSCDGTTSQRWTLAADGTLRDSGACARSEGGGTVELQSCAEGGALQWRTGAGGTLVNADADGCLTRGGDGGVRLSACGASGQSWTLP